MRLTFCLIPLLLLLPSSVLFVIAQGNDEFDTITAFYSEPLVYISFVWDREAGHQLNNISMELMSGQDTVDDIIALNVSPTVGTLYYQPHTMMPNGNFSVRVNGTVTNGDSTTPLSIASGSSTPFDISLGSLSDSTCLENTWTPIRSVEDPNYKPVRVILPTLGSVPGTSQQSVFAQSDISGTNGIIELQVSNVDQLFDLTPFDRTTAEVINTETGFNAGAQEPGFISNILTYKTSNLTLDPGPWQVRVNLTSSDAEISVLSDTFLVVDDQGDEPSCKVKTSVSTARRSGAMSNGLWGLCFLVGLSLFAV